jgi:hypothetical protein
MSNIKFSENLFLEVAEFNRFQRFMENDGFKRHFLLNTDNFGLIRQANIPEIGNISVEDNFYVSKAGTPFDQIIVNKGLALDGDGNLIINYENFNLNVPNNSLWYWVKIKYEQTSIEKGTISIDSLGNCTGIGTEFTKILRGQPNFPSKIKFTNSLNGNADEYEVVKVLDDNHIIIQGDFINEVDLKYVVVGTFTPGFVVDNSDKNIFRYDNVQISLVQETNVGNPPPYTLNYEFYIARVRNNGVNLSLQDKRVQWWQTEAANELNNLDRNLYNPLIGVENTKWDIKTSTRAKNWLEMTWGFRFESWTLDTSSKRISILIGQGGIYKDTSYFQNGDFNGWRLYSKNGKYQNIIDSIKTGTQIVITLDVLNPEDYIGGDLLFACPSYEEIEVRVRKDAAILDVNDINGNSNTTEPFPFPNVEEIHNFSINTPLARFQIPAQKGCYKYNLTYRYKIFNNYSDWQTFPDDIVGFYKEKSFDNYGNINVNPNDRERSPYVGDAEKGFINICENSYSFDAFQELLNTGDLFGVNTTQFSGADHIIHLQVTQSKKYQHFKGNANLFTLNSDIYINLKSFKDNAGLVPCREGNTFILHIEQWLDLATFKIRIVENYVNPTNYNLVAEIDNNDACYIKNNVKDANPSTRKGLLVTCTFNELGHWIAQFDSDTTVKGSVKMLKNVPINAFNTTTKEGVLPGYFGWKIIEDMNDVFPMGTNNITQIGTPGGSNSKTIDVSMLPEHDHIMFSGDDNGGPYAAQSHSTGGNFGYGVVGASSYPSIHRTAKAGGSATPSAIDLRPKFIKFLFVEKIV